MDAQETAQPYTDAALADYPYLTDVDGVDMTLGICIVTDYDGDDDGEDDEQQARAVWAQITAAALVHLAVDPAQLMLPGMPPMPAPTLPKFSDPYDGPGSIAVEFHLPVPLTDSEDRRNAAIIRALGIEVDAFAARQATANEAKDQAAAAYVAHHERRIDDAVAALVAADVAAGEILIHVRHRGTQDRLCGMIGRKVYPRQHLTEKAAGDVYGVTADELAGLKARGGKVSKLRTKDPAGWIPQVSRYQVETRIELGKA